MFMPSLREKLLGRRRSPDRPASRRQRRPCLRVEILEGRCVPATIMVTSVADVALGTNHVGVTLRDAIDAANNNRSVNGSTAGTVVADPTVFQAGLTDSMHPIPLSQGQFTISEPLTIRGLGAASTVIDGRGQSRIFDVADTAVDVTLDGLKLTGGLTTGDNSGGAFTFSGGAIHCAANSLTISNCILSGNGTRGAVAGGGALFMSGGALVVSGSTFSGNYTTTDNSRGGALYSAGGPVTVTNSTVSDNFTQGGGAGAHGGA